MGKRVATKKEDTFGVLDDPIFQEVVELCLRKIQELGVWRIFQKTQLPDGAVGLELCGAKRLVVRDGQFSVEHRNWDSGAWVEPWQAKKSVRWPEMTLRGGAQNPHTMGQGLLRGVAEWAAANAMDQIRHKLPRTDARANPHQAQLEHFRQEAMEGLLLAKARAHLLGATKNRQVAINWLAYTKAVWEHVDRDSLRLMLLRQFRKEFLISHYISMQKDARKLRRLATVSQSLVPWLPMIDTPHFERAMALMKQGRPLPREITAYAGDIQAFSAGSPWHFAGSNPDVTIVVRQVDWQVLAKQPFSFVHAMCQMDRQYHAPFLDAWLALPDSVRKKASWIIQNAPHGYNRNDTENAGPPWCLTAYDTSLWHGLVRLMVEQGVREQKQQGYAIVVSRQWRQAFFDDLARVGEWWRDNPDKRPLGQHMEVAQLLTCLPPGRFHAGYSHELLEAGTAAVQGRPVRSAARL